MIIFLWSNIHIHIKHTFLTLKSWGGCGVGVDLGSFFRGAPVLWRQIKNYEERLERERSNQNETKWNPTNQNITWRFSTCPSLFSFFFSLGKKLSIFKKKKENGVFFKQEIQFEKEISFVLSLSTLMKKKVHVKMPYVWFDLKIS